MLRLLKKLRRNERGNILIIVAAAMPLLVGSAGLAVDTIQWALWKRQLQRAADSAAMAGVYERVRAGGDTAGVANAVSSDLAINQRTGITLLADPVITFPASTTDMTNQVKVELKVRKTLAFSSFFMAEAPTIPAVATAAGVPGGGEYCVMGLDRRSTVVGIDIGGSTTVDMEKCSLIANSANPTNAATNTGNASTVKAKRLAAGGAIQASAKWQVEGYDPYSPPADDPYAGTAMPSSPSECTRTANISDKQQDYPMNRSSIDKAGDIVCINGDLKIAGQLTLGPATYVINGGDFIMNSSTSGVGVTCSSCSFLLTKFGDPTKTGNFKITGGNLNVTAPTSGTYAGIAFYQDIRATDNDSKSQNQFNGNGGSVITGAIYTPNRSLLYNGGAGVTSGPACVQIIGKRVEFTGNSKIKLFSECATGGKNGGGSVIRVRLVA
ncbi:pilus assembly protein TadG-related protein [Sphingomonas humi]|uniref:Pilus assembly protein TadG-related protein n=1 Tax=Sphingomonas humi TaxID=335630 RepID=A0ABP7S1J5_9SPHN